MRQRVCRTTPARQATHREKPGRPRYNTDTTNTTDITCVTEVRSDPPGTTAHRGSRGLAKLLRRGSSCSPRATANVHRPRRRIKIRIHGRLFAESAAQLCVATSRYHAASRWNPHAKAINCHTRIVLAICLLGKLKRTPWAYEPLPRH